MKFSQIPERNAEALRTFYLTVAETTASESQRYSHEGLRLLLVGNGAGIAVIASLSSGYLAAGGKFGELAAPVIAFLIGTLLAGLAYIPLIAVSGNAASHIGRALEAFFQDQYEVEELQSWGFTKGGRILLLSLFAAALLSFLVGMILTLYTLSGR